jgi:short subunit dehydrogenase-like uncharacterized protein
MENTNTRYVRRSCSLLKYGSGFSYYEAWTHSSFFKALLHAVGILTLIVLVMIRPFRWLLQKALPPGSGPSLEARKSGFMWVEVYGVSEVYLFL